MAAIKPFGLHFHAESPLLDRNYQQLQPEKQLNSCAEMEPFLKDKDKDLCNPFSAPN